MSKKEYNCSCQAAEDFYNGHLLISQSCTFSLNDLKTGLNNNVLIAGGSGTGKTRTLVIPNIAEAVGSYIISDPKGSLCRKYGRYLQKKGYKVMVLDFIHPEQSAHYNPMKKIHSSQDIVKLASIIIDEKKSMGTTADPYWDSMTLTFISALMGYMLETGCETLNFKTLLNLTVKGEREDDDDNISPLSRMFEKLKAQNPCSWACAKFEEVNTAPHKTYNTIRSTLVAKFATLDTEELQIMMNGDDVDFTAIGQEKTALFVTVSDTDRSMDTCVNMFFTQAMQGLCEFADNACEDNRLPVPVRFVLDDFATNCRIAEFPRMISTIRSRGISVMLIVQSEAQLWQSYNEDAHTIISNCDTYVYLGGNDLNTAKNISIRSNKPLDQVLYMPVGTCWVFRRGSRPVYSSLLDAPFYIQKMLEQDDMPEQSIL